MPERVATLRKLLESPEMREALLVMSENNPSHRVIAVDITPTFASIKLGHVAGWAEYHERLLDLARQPPLNQKPEPTYAPDN